MLGFKEFLTEEYAELPDIENNETDHEQTIQDHLFGINDYIPFDKKTNNVKESVEDHPDNPRRLVFRGQAHQGKAIGVVVPRHMWEGTKGWRKGDDINGEVKEKDSPPIMGMKERNVARAKQYGSENRPPLTKKAITSLHSSVLEEHFTPLPGESEKQHIARQEIAEKAAIGRLKAAKHLDAGNTTDKSEKTDTVNFERDKEGRGYTAAGSKGVAGYAVYTSGVGENETHHVMNTCQGQTTGCGGGVDDVTKMADTSKGTCFAPKAEIQYPSAAIRRAAHEQAKHDPAMSSDWILAHTNSLRRRANAADKQGKNFLFRPNIVDETDTTSTKAVDHLNAQRQRQNAENMSNYQLATAKQKLGRSNKPIKPVQIKTNIITNGYGKTDELHDPENGHFSTFSNTGPKVKEGKPIRENILDDAHRIRQTQLAATKESSGDFINRQGNKTPPKNTYLVTDVHRWGDIDKAMQKHITHVKYWSKPRDVSKDLGSLTPQERTQGSEGHYDGNGISTTPENAHYGHTTINGRRYDYQKQHALHPRMVEVPIKDKKTGETKLHIIPTDSRFKDDDFLPSSENRFKSRNGKNAGGILLTTPTTSTSDIEHKSGFTHHVGTEEIEHAKANKGEYEIDKPEEQEKALKSTEEYKTPSPEIKVSTKIPLKRNL